MTGMELTARVCVLYIYTSYTLQSCSYLGTSLYYGA